MSMYSFHGRGTLNGTIPHPALVALFDGTAADAGIAAAAERAYRRARRDRPTCSSSGEGVAAIDLGFPCRYTHSSLEVCDLADLVGLTQLLVDGLRADRPGLQPRPRRLPAMKHYLGIDIGTFESKGVLVDDDGPDRRAGGASRTRCSCRSRAGPSTGRARTGGTISPSSRSKLLADSGVAPTDIRAVAASAIGPCMLPVDADGEPLMNAVLYGVDTRAATEIEELTARIGEDVLLDRCGNALTSQSVGPKILWLKRNRPEIFAKAREDPDLDLLPRRSG